jgi:Zn-dependent metalloprotease
MGGHAWEKPFRIWDESVRRLRPNATFQDLANATAGAAKRLYGDKAANDTVAAWQVVGLSARIKN